MKSMLVGTAIACTVTVATHASAAPPEKTHSGSAYGNASFYDVDDNCTCVNEDDICLAGGVDVMVSKYSLPGGITSLFVDLDQYNACTGDQLYYAEGYSEDLDSSLFVVGKKASNATLKATIPGSLWIGSDDPVPIQIKVEMIWLPSSPPAKTHSVYHNSSIYSLSVSRARGLSVESNAAGFVGFDEENQTQKFIHKDSSYSDNAEVTVYHQRKIK